MTKEPIYTVFRGMLIVVESPDKPPYVIDKDGAREMKPGWNGSYVVNYTEE